MSNPSPSRSRQAYERLETLIVSLDLAPGADVTEKELVSLAGFGRTPVREAVLELAAEGLIHIRPRSGLLIAPLDVDHPALVLAARRQIEPLIVALSASHVDERARVHLIACARDMTECALTSDKRGYLRPARIFDQVMARCCPNPFLVRAVERIRSQGRRCWFATTDERSLEWTAQVQARVIRHLINARADEAEASMRELLSEPHPPP